MANHGYICQGNPREILRLNPNDKFQFPHHIKKIAETPIVSLQKLPLQDRSVEGIYHQKMVMYNRIHARNSTMKFICLDFPPCKRFPN